MTNRLIFSSWNMRGLSDANKRYIVFNKIAKYHPVIDYMCTGNPVFNALRILERI